MRRSAGRAEPPFVPLFRSGRPVGVEQEPSVLGNKAEEEPVDEPQERFPHVLLAHPAIHQPVMEVVRRVPQEAGPERLDGLLHTRAERLECTGAGLGGVGAPAFQPAVGDGGVVALVRLEPARMADEEQHHEVAEDLAVEHRL